MPPRWGNAKGASVDSIYNAQAEAAGGCKWRPQGCPACHLQYPWGICCPYSTECKDGTRCKDGKLVYCHGGLAGTA